MKEMFSNKKRNSLFILILLLLPLFYINVKDTHDWGDDFALYIHQAKNLVNGLDPQDTKLVFNEDNPIMISSVSIGFSILIAPVTALFGINIKPYLYLISFFLVLAGILLFLFFEKKMPTILAIIFSLLVVYHRWTLSAKTDILSDIPFLAFITLIFILYNNVKNKRIVNAILIGIISGFTISLRMMGIVFPLAVFAWLIYYVLFVYPKNRDKSLKEIILFNGILIVVSFLSFLTLDNVFFPAASQGSYFDYFNAHSVSEVIQTNFFGYIGWFRWFTSLYHMMGAMHVISFVLFTSFMILGIFKKIQKEFNYLDIFFFGYLFIIIIYPASPGFRYLFPLIPFWLLYFYKGITWIEEITKIRKHKLSIFLGFFLLLQYYPGIYKNIEDTRIPQDGPQTSASIEVFNYIKNNTPDTALVIFRKPRALALYTGRHGIANDLKLRNADSVEITCQKYNVDYLLYNIEDLKDSSLIDYLDKYIGKYKIIFQNERFFLYQRIDI